MTEPTSAGDVGGDLNQTASNNSGTAIPEGWAVYIPLEGDFSVIAPQDAVQTDVKEIAGSAKIRSYVFKKGQTGHFSVDLWSERAGPFAGNSVEELRTDTDILPGTLRDVSLAGMPGIEFRMTGAIGETVFREFCSADNTRAVSLLVQKDTGEGLTEDEVRLFLDSFTLTP